MTEISGGEASVVGDVYGLTVMLAYQRKWPGQNDTDHGAAVIDIYFKTDAAGRSRASFS